MKKLSQFVKEAQEKEVDEDAQTGEWQWGAKVEDELAELGDELDQAETNRIELLEGEEPTAGEESVEKKPRKARKVAPHHELITPYVEKFIGLLERGEEVMTEWMRVEDELAPMNEVLQRNDALAHPLIAKNKKAKEWLLSHGKKKRVKRDTAKNAEIIQGLVKVANELDALGDAESLEKVESTLQAFAKKEEYAPPKYNVHNDRNVLKTERHYPTPEPVAPSLSTRYCPDHNGIYMKRIADGAFQCELDGRVYNWNEGFKDYAGNVFPGDAIHSVDFPESVDRAFETRELATRKRVK